MPTLNYKFLCKRYLYGTSGARSEKVKKFFEPTKESLELEKKFDQLGEDLRRQVLQIWTEPVAKLTPTTF